jgi:hypothetical protein
MPALFNSNMWASISERCQMRKKEETNEDISVSYFDSRDFIRFSVIVSKDFFTISEAAYAGTP